VVYEEIGTQNKLAINIKLDTEAEASVLHKQAYAVQG